MIKNQRRHVGFLHFVIGSFLMASHSSKSTKISLIIKRSNSWQIVHSPQVNYISMVSQTVRLFQLPGFPAHTHKKIKFESRTVDRPFPSCPNASVLKQEYKNKPFTYSVIKTHTVYLWPFFRISVFLTDTRWFWKIKTQKERFYCSAYLSWYDQQGYTPWKNFYTLYS